MTISKKPRSICVTGGKGGTGKTLCAVNIAIMLKNDGYKVLLIDGDVENPNAHLLLGGMLENKTEVPFFMPKILEDLCSKCGKCAQNCATHALLHIENSFPIPITALCSGCKLCYKICPEKAIEASSKIIGWTYSTEINGLSLLLGELKPSEARSAAVIENLLEDYKEIIKKDSSKFDFVVFDTAPGAHCDVELLIGTADYIIPVTEPTRFGKLDLNRIIELIKLLGKNYKAIVNRSSLLGFKDQFLKELDEIGVEILGDIPLDDDIVNSYCQGKPLMDNEGDFNRNGPGFRAFNKIFESLKKWLNIN